MSNTLTCDTQQTNHLVAPVETFILVMVNS